MELAVNMPEQEPQVGQAERSYSATFSSLASVSAAMTMASTRSSLCSDSAVLPASIGPPDTNTTGMFRRIAALSMPGVILSQLEMQTMASAQWALTMYSTESEMMSRLGPGTNWVKELTTAMIGLPKSPSCMPVARQRARAPAMLRPWVDVLERYAGITGYLFPGVS